MYSWERRGGTLPDRHKEPITQDEVLADLARTRDLLTGTHLDPTKKKEDPEDLTSTTGMLAAPELEETLDTSAYDTWTDAKSDAAESYARGDFVAAAGRFAAAAAMLDPTEDKNGIHAAALQSNRSSALLAAGRPADALLAADACVATRPSWHKARFRRAEALFAMRRFTDAADDFREATRLSGDGPESPGPDPILAKRLAECDAALALIVDLTTMETKEVEEKEEAERKAKNEEQEQRDKQIAELTAAAEERERDPRVKALFTQLEKTFSDAKNAGSTTGPDPYVCVDILNRILEIEPDFTACSFQLALTQRRLGKHAAAVETMRTCLRTGQGFMTGYMQFGQMLELIHGKECRGFQEAEVLYAHIVQRFFDHPDAWIALSTLLIRTGRVNEAVGVIRAAQTGGPEGKFVKPRQDGGVLMTLAFAQHMRGHTAEPTSLYMLSANSGGGAAAMFLLKRIFEDGGDDENAETYATALMQVKVDVPEQLWVSFEAINWYYAAPHWVPLIGKVGFAARARETGLEGVFVPYSLDVFEGKDSAVGTSDFIPGDYIAKGKHRVYEGTQEGTPRVRHCVCVEDIVNFLGDDAECLLAQRCVKDPALIDGGRKYSLHFYVVVFAVDETAETAVDEGETDGPKPTGVIVDASVTRGFKLCVAPEPYVEGCEDDDSHLTNRGAFGDGGTVNFTEVDDLNAFALRSGLDWDGVVWPAITNALRETLRALCGGMVGDGDAIGDFSMRAHQSMRIPKIVEATFVLDAASAPWLVDLSQPDCVNPRAKTLHGAVEEAMGCRGDGESALIPLF